MHPFQQHPMGGGWPASYGAYHNGYGNQHPHPSLATPGSNPPGGWPAQQHPQQQHHNTTPYVDTSTSQVAHGHHSHVHLTPGSVGRPSAAQAAGTRGPSATPELPAQKRHRPDPTHQQQQRTSKSSAAAKPSQQQQPAPAAASNTKADLEQAWYDQLSFEVENLVRAARPSPEEQQLRQRAIDLVNSVVSSALSRTYPYASCHPFGSWASGLTLHSSDVDMAITGVCEPDSTGGGFTTQTKEIVGKVLRSVHGAAIQTAADYNMQVVASKLVFFARIPVLKLQLEGGVELDLSVNDLTGTHAADYVKDMARRFPRLPEVVVVLKLVLRQRGLAEVFSGGLGSWSLTNMVMAHLQEEAKAGRSTSHLGQLLEAFLQRYGREFEYSSQAVAVGRGGIVRRSQLMADLRYDYGGAPFLALEDPLTGREVAGGSNRMADVAALFSKLAGRLAADRKFASSPEGAGDLARAREQHRQLLEGGSSTGAAVGGLEILRVAGSDYEVLPMLLSVADAVDRDRRRQELEAQAVEWGGAARAGGYRGYRARR